MMYRYELLYGKVVHFIIGTKFYGMDFWTFDIIPNLSICYFQETFHIHFDIFIFYIDFELCFSKSENDW